MKTLFKFLGAIALIVLIIAIVAKVQNESETRATQQIATEQRENEDAIKQRHVLVGMSAAQVRQAWGEPKHVIRTTAESHEYEEWSYGAHATLSFVDGVFKSGTRDDGK